MQTKNWPKQALPLPWLPQLSNLSVHFYFLFLFMLESGIKVMQTEVKSLAFSLKALLKLTMYSLTPDATKKVIQTLEEGGGGVNQSSPLLPT